MKTLTCRWHYLRIISGLFFYLFIIVPPANSQYFGRNKPSYRVFDFNVYQTPNFELYHYLENDSALTMLANRSEAWYNLHQNLFRDTISERNPVMFYENHAEFQQTTAVSGLLSESTGGVTEAFKQRVIMPLFPSFAQTDQILGHELVHAFQYNMLINNDSIGLSRINNLPLWMVEGMAEYFSNGSVDPHTAMWMRDAVLTRDIPTLKDMTRSNEYFPYRYGQAVIAMIGKTWGDSLIVPLFRKTAINGYEKAFKEVLGVDEKTFSEMWKESLIKSYKPLLSDTLDIPAGKKILFARNAGKMNITPSVSPDGKLIAFLSERDVFTLDLFLADAGSGKIIRKLSRRINKNEIDALSFLESSGTWSPDSKQFAFVVFSEGKNKMLILNTGRRGKPREIELEGLPAINNPSWSPDGKYIALTGMRDGVSDIFLYETVTGQIRQLTHDNFANLQPSWSPDGRYLAFVTDKPLQGQNAGSSPYYYNIAVVDISEPSSERLPVLFTGAKNMNPVFSNDGSSIYFLSDRDGFRNLYKYSIHKDSIWQMTEYMRGITGITFHSPAISLSRETGDIVYSYYSERSYSIFSAKKEDFKYIPVAKNDIDFTAATLPPFEYASLNLVDNSLKQGVASPEMSESEFRHVPYRPKFKLDYISNASAGVATGRMGTGMAGSISAIFGDMTGDNQIFASVALNGEIYDFGAQVAYINQKRRLKWGATMSHIPYYYGSLSFGIDTLNIGGESYLVDRVNLNYLRMFEDQVSLFAYYPLSQTRRFEFSGQASLYSYRFDQYITYYDVLGTSIGSDRRKMDAPEGFSLQRADAAYVVDNSVFGVTGPVSGTRLRLEAGKYFGGLNFFTTLADFRKYVQIRPYTFAFRLYSNGRWGTGAESGMLTPMYIAYPWLIRGYDRSDSYWWETQMEGSGAGLGNFFGSKIFIANAEFRIPFSGPANYSLIKSKLFFTDFNLFFDGGLALDKGSKVSQNWFLPGPGERVPVFSYGVSLRLNLFGIAVVEPFYAVPLRPGVDPLKGSFGVNFTPGW